MTEFPSSTQLIDKEPKIPGNEMKCDKDFELPTMPTGKSGIFGQALLRGREAFASGAGITASNSANGRSGKRSDDSAFTLPATPSPGRRRKGGSASPR